ncbi:MAG: class I tRNA ligase family protein, partial [Planctomycetes bacterium]|nr:class I tRNA ligase family protein [Planctomycetota bacterium]
LIDLYGTDAMRFTLTQMATETQDMRMPVSYLCPHCRTLIAQDSVVPKNKVPAQVQKVTCKHCKQPFATVWASDELKKELAVARDTSDRFELGRNFCNKLWQAATGFVFPNIGRAAGFSPRGAKEISWPRQLDPDVLAMEDHWILSRLRACIEEVDRRFERYQLNDAANALYAFFWGEFCDWYVELVKPRLFSRNDAGEMVRHDDESAQIAQQVLTWVLDQTLRLLHPVMPFVTEELWHRLNEAAPQRGIGQLHTVTSRGLQPARSAQRGASPDSEISPALIVAAWPDASAWKREAAVEREMQALQDVIRALREIRNHVNGIRSAARESAIKTLPRAVVKAEADLAKALRDHEAMIHRLGQCEALEIGPDLTRPPESISKVLSGIEVYVPLSGLADLEIERKRLKKEREELGGHTRRLEGKLANEGFVSKAPAEVVERERTRLTELREKLAAVERNLAEVGG